MKKLFSRERGVTIITVTTMVIVILVIIAVFGFYARNSVKMESFQGMKADIKEIEAKALLYYVDYKALPITNVSDYEDHFSFGDEEFRNPNDSDKYYKVDLSKLGVTNAYNTEYYINDTTLTVYANNPILINSKNYGRFKEQFDKFGTKEETDPIVPEWAVEAPAEMYTYDDDNWITGVDAEFCNNPANREKYSYYFTDAINWKNVIIPAYRANGEPVIGIRSSAFANVNINGGSIKIPATTKIMEASLFNGASNPHDIYCDGIIVDVNSFKGLGFNNVEEITIGPNCQIPDGDVVNGGVFSNAQNLKKVTIEGSSIGKYTFSGKCINVQNIYLLGSPTKIPEGAFKDCGKNANIRIHVNENSTADEIVFPSSVTIFEKDCFNGSGITNLVLPSNATEIGEGAFSNMGNRLQSLALNMELEIIGKNAFYGDFNLRQITYEGRNNRFNPNLKTIGDSAFSGCGFNGTIYLPSQTTIGNNVWPNNVSIQRF